MKLSSNPLNEGLVNFSSSNTKSRDLRVSVLKMGVLAFLLLGVSPVAVQAANPTPSPSPSPSPTVTPTPTPLPLISGSSNPVAPPPTSGQEQCNAQTQVEQHQVGLSSLLGVPCIRGNNQPTLYEKYPSSAYQLHTASELPDPTQFLNGISNALASWFLTIMVTIASFCGTLLEWTFALELAGGLNTQLNANGVLTSIVTSLGNNIYKPFFITAVTVAGLYVLWYGMLKRRMTVTLESAGWVLLAGAVAAFFLAAPTWAIGSLDSLSLYASKLILGTVAQVDPQLSSPAYQSTYNQDPNTQQYSGLRAAINRYWDIYVYKPWEVAEFGSIDFAEQKTANGLTYGEWDLQTQSQDSQARQQFETAVLGQMDANQQPQLKEWFQGHQGASRASLLALALIAAGLSTALLLVIAGSVIIAQLGLVLMTMVAPLLFLVGIHPGSGRQIFMRWGELMLNFMVRRVLYSAFLAVILVFAGVIVGGMSSQSWLLASSLQILFIVGALLSRKRLATLFTQSGMGKLDQHLDPYRSRIRDKWNDLRGRSPINPEMGDPTRKPEAPLLAATAGAAAGPSSGGDEGGNLGGRVRDGAPQGPSGGDGAAPSAGEASPATTSASSGRESVSDLYPTPGSQPPPGSDPHQDESMDRSRRRQTLWDENLGTTPEEQQESEQSRRSKVRDMLSKQFTEPDILPHLPKPPERED